MPRVVAPRSSAGDGSGGTLHTYTQTGVGPVAPRGELYKYGAPPRPTNARKLHAESGSCEVGLLFHKRGDWNARGSTFASL